MQGMTVLITGAGTTNFHGVVQGIRSQSEFAVRVIGCDMNPLNTGRHIADAFHVVPPGSDPRFVETVLELCRVHDVQLLIPIIDYELPALAGARSRFDAVGCKLALSGPETVERCIDKWRTYQFLSEHGIPTPRTWLPDALPDELDFPLFIKPRRFGRATLDCHWIDDEAALCYQLRRSADPLVQEAVVGQLHSVDVLSDFDGRVVNALVRRTVESKSGVVTKARTVRDPELLELAITTGEQLGMVGAFGIDCFRHSEGVCVIEVNARVQSGLAMSIGAGFNIPAELLRLAAGREVPRRSGEYQVGAQMVRYWSEMFTQCDDNGDGPPAAILPVFAP